MLLKGRLGLLSRLGSLLRPAFRASDPVSPCGFPIDLGGVLACFRAPEVSEPFSFETDIRLDPSLRKSPLPPFRRESPIVGKSRPTRAFCFAGVRVNFFRGCGGPFFIRERGVHGIRSFRSFRRIPQTFAFSISCTTTFRLRILRKGRLHLSHSFNDLVVWNTGSEHVLQGDGDNTHSVPFHSDRSRSRLLALQGPQATERLSSVLRPPRPTGTMWSI